MTQQDLKDIIGYIEAYPDVYDIDDGGAHYGVIYYYESDNLKCVYAEHIIDNKSCYFTDPEEVRQDILEYLYRIPKEVFNSHFKQDDEMKKVIAVKDIFYNQDNEMGKIEKGTEGFYIRKSDNVLYPFKINFGTKYINCSGDEYTKLDNLKSNQRSE